jgi:hypothetical protein
MKKTIVLLFLVLAFLISCKSKVISKGNSFVENKEVNYIHYYLKVIEADSLHIVGNYKQSQQILDSLFQKFEPLNQESYGEYITYLKNKILLKDFKNLNIVLKKAIQDFGFKVEYCLKDTLISIAVKKSKYKELELNSFYDTYSKSLNLEYRYAIEKMIENDQRVRNAVPRDKEDWQKVDSANAHSIKLLIAKHGYPSVNKIGRYDFNNKSANAHILFNHSTTEVKEGYLLDLMFESLKKGHCLSEHYGTVYDKYLRVTGKYGDKVLYGELRNSNKSIVDHVVNPIKIDSIRKSIGLEHIEYKRWKLKKLTGKDIDDL